MARARLEPGTAGLRVRRADHSATLSPNNDHGGDVVVDDDYDDDELNYGSFVRLIELTFSQSSRRYNKMGLFLILASFHSVIN